MTKRRLAALLAAAVTGSALLAGAAPAAADVADMLVAPDGQYQYLRAATSLSLPFSSADEVSDAVLSAAGTHAYLASENGEVVLVDRTASTWRRASGLDWGADPEGLAVSPVTGLIYVPQPSSDQIRVLNADGIVVAGIPTDGEPTGVAISADGATLVTLAVNTSGVDVIDRIDVASGQITERLATDAGTGVVVADRAADVVYTVDPDDGHLYAADLRTRAVRSVAVGRSAAAVALDPGQDTAYVAGTGAAGTGAVSIVDLASMTVRRTDPVGGDPIDVREAPRGGSLFVALEDGFVVSDDLATGTLTGRERLGAVPMGFLDSATGPLLFDDTGTIWSAQHFWPQPTGKPVIVGKPKVGARLTVQWGSLPANATMKVQWRTDSRTPLTHGYGNPWVISGHLVGRAVYAEVSILYPNPDGSVTSITADTAATGVITTGSLATATPKISGTPKTGRWIAATTETWTAGTGFTYHWYANGRQLKSLAGKPKFKVTPALLAALAGKRLTVRVTGSQLGYVSASRTSKVVKVPAARHPAAKKR